MFSPNDDQQLLMDSARRFTQKHYADDRLESMGAAPHNAALYGEMAEAGWLMLPFAEADGGLQADGQSGLADCASLFETLGEGLVVEPVLASGILAGSLIAASPSDQRGDLIEAIMGGEVIGCALNEPRARHDIAWCETSAVKDGKGGWTLSGMKSLSYGGGGAERFVVVARIKGEPGDGADGLALFLVPADTPGVTVRRYRLRDDHWVADLVLEASEVDGSAMLLGTGETAEALHAMIAKARLMMAAEAVGIMKRVTGATQTYTSDRKQFGKALASFQVLQHKMVDMAVAHEQTRSLVYQAITHDEAGDLEARDEAIIAAYRSAGEDGLAVTKEAIQLHGGMGMSEELPMGRAMRRILAIRLAFPVGQTLGTE